MSYMNKSLTNSEKNGLIRYYRKPDNFATTKIGFLVARRLKKKISRKNLPRSKNIVSILIVFLGGEHNPILKI